MRLSLFLATLLAFVAAALPAAAQTAEQRRQLDWVLERGRLLYALDRAAWVGTDDMLERVPEDQRRTLKYIVDRDEQGFTTIFYAEENGRLVAAYRGRVGPNGIASREVFEPGRRPELTPRQRRLARTMGQLIDAAPRLTLCGRTRPNIAIVPPETLDGPIDLYVMTPQTETDVIPFGGHHRLTFDKDGRILSQRAFTNSCINISTRPPSGEGQTSALTMSHLLDPIPTEIHVFSAMAARLPVYVMTTENRHLWAVAGDRITLSSPEITAERPSGDRR